MGIRSVQSAAYSVFRQRTNITCSNMRDTSPASATFIIGILSEKENIMCCLVSLSIRSNFLESYKPIIKRNNAEMSSKQGVALIDTSFLTIKTTIAALIFAFMECLGYCTAININIELVFCCVSNIRLTCCS